MKKIITLLMLTFIVSISYAQYTPMTASGYQFKRILCDSTLHIPSFCGIPTLRNSTAKNGAIAMDTCSGKFYMWTNLAGWSQITGVGTDTTSLSNRIDQRVKYTDTSAMLTAYLRKQDTANKFVANVTKVNDSTIRVFKGTTITDLKILGKGTDTSSLSTRIDARVKYTDTSAMLLPYLRKTDTTAMLSKYLRKTDTASLSNRINLKVNISDTATMLSKYLRKTDTASLSNRINLKVNISDTATMLSKYLRKTDTASLSNRINLKLNIADTTNKWVSNVTKKNDSTITIFKGTSSTDITLPRGSGGSGGSQNLQQVTDIGNTTTHELIVDDGIVFNEKLGLTDYGNNIIYPLRYTNVFQGALDIIDSLTTYPPTIFGYNNTSTNPSYKIGYNSSNGKPFIDFIGVDSKLKITDEFISFSDNGIAITKLQPIPNGNSDIHYLPQNDGLDDTLLIQAPQDGQYYAQQNGGWVSFTPGGGGTGTVTNVATGYGLSGGPITTTGTLEVDTATLSTKYIRIGESQNGRFGNDTANVIMAKIHNNTGAILTNGKVVALSSSGTNADAPSVRLANNKHDSTSANTLGFVTGSIAVNDTGWVIISGKIEKLNTSAFSNGDIIYLDSISGNWTKTKPVAPYHMVYLGVVIKANAGNGSIFVKCQNGYELDEIHDVQITGKANNQVLAYSDTQKVWKNRNIYSIVDTTSLSSRINLKLNISDTSVFQRKSLSSYTVMANNTNATANATAQTYRDVAEQNMTNTITWSSGTAPSTLTSANYSWSQIGKTVTFIFNALYVNAATSITGMFFDLPSDLPTPAIPTGWTGASGYLYTGTTTTHLTATAITNTTYPAYLRRNAANTAYEVGFTGTSSARGYKIIITYRAQ